MDIKIKMEAVVAGLLAVKDNYMFTIRDQIIAVSPRLNPTKIHYIFFDDDNFFKAIMTDEECKNLGDNFEDAVD